MKAIVAVGIDNAIGKDNSMAWHIKDDFKHFKETTLESIVVMGRKTYESIGKSLPRRHNVILTRDTDYIPYEDSDIVINSYDELEDVQRKHPNCDMFIIGGANVYSELFDKFETIYYTKVFKKIDDADAYFPNINLKVWDFEVIREPYYDGNQLVCEYYKLTRKPLLQLPMLASGFSETILDEFSENDMRVYNMCVDVCDMSKLSHELYTLLESKGYDVEFKVKR